MTPSHDELKDAGCWFDSDRAGGDEMTNFKREARWRQHRWAVDELSIHSFGTHRGRRKDPDEEPELVHNGTKLLDADADAGANFLSPAILDAVEQRLLDKQLHQTLEPRRLRRDLLSSMPMAFNLFGEAAQAVNEKSRQALAALFGVEAGAPSDIIFEWSPGRRGAEYTRDRTAFDVALRLGAPGSARTVVGIETKYHEHSEKEPRPSASKPDAAARYAEQTDFLASIAEASGVFRSGWQDAVLATDLRQIWRDHLLALSMRRHVDWTEESKYVLLYPARNVSFAAAAAAYKELLADGDTSFGSFTLEEVVDAAFAHGGDTKAAFVRRYLW